ncbi:MAG: bifunctional oligoribonuclease/PAP phosphatase NrnA [Ruminococcus sp.]|nr:bifunctional oligoribonuclease/PAP phosphatase NrnA [Ruminococcus sp.]
MENRNNIGFANIGRFFEEHDCFTILTHKSPDGDTLGAGFALCAYLRKMGKKANVLNSDGFPDRYSFLYEGYFDMGFDEQCVIAVDIADTTLLGAGLARYTEPKSIDLCIDHHISNKYYAKYSYVDSTASAACLILYQLFKELGRPINDLIAKCLYTGIATDTGCFKYENTVPQAHLAAAELMQFNIGFASVNRKMFDIKSRARLRAEIIATNSIEYSFGGKCAVISLTTEMMESFGIEPAEFEGISSIPLTVEGVEIGITIRQRHENVFKLSVRTTEKIDASGFCRQFGGGGHIRAAGCEITGTLEEVKKTVIEAVSKLDGVIS